MHIHEDVTLGENVTIGHYTIIEADVVIGNDVEIGSHCVIKKGTIIGEGVKMGDFVILGKLPTTNNQMARKPATNLGPLQIGPGSVIGSHVTLYAGTGIRDGAYLADHVSIREQVTIGSHTIIGRNVMIEPSTTVGSNVTIQTSSYITADTIIEDGVFIGPCCSMSNDKYMASGKGTHTGPILKKGAKIGNNATLLPNIEIGEKAIVGAGAVVTKSVPANETVVGNPASRL
ncbi:N-acetyltransferase [Ornithinibacillus contaminans]|uniref:N-acetyltransferase n=1 Tax=Ornithinibacillus contaminans TaxID=694055 RepID=UPI00064DE9E6|nr:N-acetyltransferase [Ornithinibacillus contaminans]